MALISDLPNATPQKSDLMEIQNGQNSSNNSSVGQLMQLSASENLAPAYDANAGVYAVGDFVSYNGTLYQCNTAIATPEAFDATKWTAVKVTEISSGASVVQKTQAEYDLLTTEQKMNGSIYKITDNAKMYCLDKAYHPVEECTVAEYNQKSTAQQNDGTIYIQTDAETTGEDIPVNTITPNTSINSAINACFGRTGSDIPVSSSNPTSIAAAIDELKPEITTQIVDGISWTIKRNGKFYEMWADISIDASAVTPAQWGSLYVYRNSKTTYLLPVTLVKKVCDLSFSSGATATMTVYYTDLSNYENEKTSADVIRPTPITATIVVHKYICGYVN